MDVSGGDGWGVGQIDGDGSRRIRRRFWRAHCATTPAYFVALDALERVRVALLDAPDAQDGSPRGSVVGPKGLLPWSGWGANQC
jgi:hypothetical protein